MFKKTKNFLSAWVALIMVFLVFTVAVSANSGNYSLGDTSELVYFSDSFIPTELHNLGSGYNAYTHCLFEEVALTGEPFDKAVRYRKLTTFSNQRWDIYCKALTSLDGVVYDTDDILTLSFYYKGSVTGTYYDGTAFNSTSLHAYIQDSNSTKFNDLNSQSSQLSQNYELVSDGSWHKVTLYRNIDGYSGDVNIYFPFTTDTVDMLFADFRIGVVHLSDSWQGGYTNDVAYSTLSDVLMDYSSAAVSTLTVNGEDMDLSGNQNEFNVTVDSYNVPQIELSGGNVGLEKKIRKIAYNRYEVTPCAPAYNPTVGDDANITFRVRNNSEMLYPERQNSTFIGEDKYYINLELDDNFTMFKSSGAKHSVATDLRNTYVEYTEYDRSPEKFDDALFPYGYSVRFLENDAPEGTLENNAFIFNFDLNGKEVNPEDFVYFQWYMKVDTEGEVSSFTYRPRAVHQEEDYTVSENLIPIGSGLGTYANHGDILTTQLNNGWFKCEGLYEALNGIDGDVTLRIEFPWLTGNAMDIKLAEPACGILNFREGDVPEESETINASAINNHKKSMIRDVVSTMDPVAMIIDGETVEIGDLSTLSASTAELENKISVTGLHSTVMADINRSDIVAPYTASIRAYAPGFDKTKGVSGQTATYLYRKYKKDANGNWVYAGQLDGPLSNANMYKDYTLNVSRSADFAERAFYVDSALVSDYSDLTGESFCYKELISAPDNSDSVWAVFAAYDEDNRLVSVDAKQYDFSDDNDRKIVNLKLNADNEDNSLTFKVYMFNNSRSLTPLIPAHLINPAE